MFFITPVDILKLVKLKRITSTTGMMKVKIRKAKVGRMNKIPTMTSLVL